MVLRNRGYEGPVKPTRPRKPIIVEYRAGVPRRRHVLYTYYYAESPFLTVK